MAWPTAPNDGDIIEAALMDEIIDALALWGGNVDAAGFNLSNVGNLTMSGTLTVTGAFSTAIGSIIIGPQNVGALEGGEVELQNHDATKSYKIDVLDSDFRIFHSPSGVVFLKFDDGTAAVHLFIDGSTKQLSVGAADSGGSGFKVLRVPN